MRRSNVQNIGEVVKELLKEMHIEHKMKEIALVNAWPEVLGPYIAKVTSRVYVKNRVLFVTLTSPVVRNELMMMKTKIIQALNDRVGEPVIDEVVLK